MTVLAIVATILLILLAIAYVSFSRHMARRIEASAEYIEFLFQNRVVFEDHRTKYISMLREVLSQRPQITLRDLALHSKRAIDDMAAKLHEQAAFTNALGRGMVDKWAASDSAATALRDHLAERAKTVE